MINILYIDIDWIIEIYIWKFENYIVYLIYNVVWFLYILSYMVFSVINYVINYYMFFFLIVLVLINK